VNGKLILRLSLFGLAMAVATVFVVPQRAEPFLWLPIFVYCAYVIAKSVPERPFVHGLLLGPVAAWRRRVAWSARSWRPCSSRRT